MSQLKRPTLTVNILIVAFKLFSVSAGSAFLIFSVSYLLSGFLYSEDAGRIGLETVLFLIASFAGLISSIALIAILPESLRVRFRKLRARGLPRPTYGFSSLLAVGVGATFGSPLFIVLPGNIEQYAIISVGSMIIAAVLSVLMARIYSKMYVYSREHRSEVIGGPSFTKIGTGSRSVRYFISRFSMWIANTALAAFSAIFFVVFTFQYLPEIMGILGAGSLITNVAVYLIIAAFVIWFIINAFFEERFLKHIGYSQIVFIVIILAIIISQSFFLGSSGGWNLQGFFLPAENNMFLDLLINTGYLFILFFGFQEILAMDRETKEESDIPLYSRISGVRKIPKTRFMGIAMLLTVVITAAVKIFYAISVYSVHPDSAELSSSEIPALFVSGHFLGAYWETAMAVAFLLATITTFVPAFIAASRHLRSLGEDGFFPRSIASVSWIFTIIMILLLSLGGGEFLISITDFMVLISIGIIILSYLWMRKVRVLSMKGKDIMAVILGASLFAAGGAIYFVDPNVVLLGVIAVVISFLIYDVLHLGAVGLQIFIAAFDLVAFLSIAVFHGVVPGYFSMILYNLFGLSYSIRTVIETVLLGSSAIIITNLFLDVFVIKRTRVRFRKA